MKQLPLDVGRYTIREAKRTGGKAGKGHNKTSTIQVYYKRYYIVVKSFRYTMNDMVSKERAIEKAVAFARQEIIKVNS